MVVPERSHAQKGTQNRVNLVSDPELADVKLIHLYAESITSISPCELHGLYDSVALLKSTLNNQKRKVHGNELVNATIR